MMQKAFGNECMSKTRIKEWYNRFKGGLTSVDSDSRSGRPSTTKTLDSIERVRLVIEQDRRMTVRGLKKDLGMPKTIIWEILTSNLQITHVCAKFIPKLLSAEQKKLCLESCAAIFAKTQDCTAPIASVQSRHSSLRFLNVTKIENGAQRKAVRRHRHDSE